MRDRIYFDNNATTAPSDAVVKAMIELIQEPMNASSIHSFGREARNLVESARKKIRSPAIGEKRAEMLMVLSTKK